MTAEWPWSCNLGFSWVMYVLKILWDTLPKSSLQIGNCMYPQIITDYYISKRRIYRSTYRNFMTVWDKREQTTAGKHFKFHSEIQRQLRKLGTLWATFPIWLHDLTELSRILKTIWHFTSNVNLTTLLPYMTLQITANDRIFRFQLIDSLKFHYRW